MVISSQTVWVHLAGGIGNIVLATPLLVALSRLEFCIDLWLDADYQEASDLFRDWGALRSVRDRRSEFPRSNGFVFVIAAVPPFYWPRLSRFHQQHARLVPRPPNCLFYQNEQEYYLAFARTLGFPATSTPFYTLPIVSSHSSLVDAQTLVLAPGCKTGEMAAKRWPYFPELAEAFDNVVVVGTPDDLRRPDGKLVSFPQHVRFLTGKLTLRETAEVIASAGAFVGNDSGLSHISGAVGTPTIMIFGPTPHSALGVFPPNVRVLRTGLPCEPCWFGERFRACSRQFYCLGGLAVSQVIEAIVGHCGVHPSNQQSQA